MAAYTWTGALSSNWSTAGNWISVPVTGTAPGAADTVVINNAVACTVTAASSCLTINFTGYSSTFTINSGFTLTVGTTITLAATMLPIGGAGRFQSLGSTTAFTINFNGKTIPNLQLGFTAGAGTQTVTVSGPTPTVQNLIVSNGLSGITALAGTALNIS